jgi:hypothetical protein
MWGRDGFYEAVALFSLEWEHANLKSNASLSLLREQSSMSCAVTDIVQPYVVYRCCCGMLATCIIQ